MSCFADTETPTRWGKQTACCPQTQRPQMEWNRRWMVLIPNDLSVNQSEEGPWADHTLHNPPSLTLSLKTLPCESWENSGLLNTSCLDSSLSTCKKCCTFLHHDLESVDGLYRVDPKKPRIQICIGTTTIFPFPEVKKVATLWVHMKLLSSFKKDLNTTTDTI